LDGEKELAGAFGASNVAMLAMRCEKKVGAEMVWRLWRLLKRTFKQCRALPVQVWVQARA
jgi:hypothetical protein